MIVLIQMLIEKYRESVEQWERDREEWVSGGTYRSLSDYAHHYAHPREKFILAGRVVGCFVIVFGGILLIASSIDRENERYDKKYAIASRGKNCQAHNLNDRVKIDDGEYEGKTAVIVGGCKKGEDYQVKLDAGQKFDYSSDGQNAVDLRQDVISVEDYRDLIKIEEKKDESK